MTSEHGKPTSSPLYVGIAGLRRILEGPIRFTQPSAFNDPFELLPENTLAFAPRFSRAQAVAVAIPIEKRTAADPSISRPRWLSANVRLNPCCSARSPASVPCRSEKTCSSPAETYIASCKRNTNNNFLGGLRVLNTSKISRPATMPTVCSSSLKVLPTANSGSAQRRC